MRLEFYAHLIMNTFADMKRLLLMERKCILLWNMLQEVIYLKKFKNVKEIDRI